jgi:hypothetical protein
MKKASGFLCILALCAIAAGAGCSGSKKSNSPTSPSSKEITAFRVTSPVATGFIDETAKTIAVSVPSGTALNALTPTIIINGASVSPASGVSQDFTSPVTYMVTAADGSTQAYNVTVAIKVAVTSVTISRSPATVLVAGTTQLTAAIAPTNATIQTVTWTSSDTSLATVDSTGLVTALPTVGYVTITATSTDDTTIQGARLVAINKYASTTVVTSGSGTSASTTYTLPTGTAFKTIQTTLDTLSSGIIFPMNAGDDSTGTMSTPFVMAETLTTYELWSTIYTWATSHGYNIKSAGQMGTNSSLYENTAGGSQQPVMNICWRDAMVWCNALTEYYNANNDTATDLDCVYYTDAAYATPLRTSTTSSIIDTTAGTQDDPYIKAFSTGNFDMANCTAKGFRLPTSNEYEFAARYMMASTSYAISHTTKSALTAGYFWTPGLYASGATADYSNDAPTFAVAVFKTYNSSASGATGVTTTAVVKSKTANALGLYDMNGNAWEWCFDWHPTYVGSSRILRGGSFFSDANFMKVGFVNYAAPYGENGTIGFRFARTK